MTKAYCNMRCPQCTKWVDLEFNCSCATGPWRPISEAKKDEKWVLLKTNKALPWIGIWDKELLNWIDDHGDALPIGTLAPTHFAELNPLEEEG